MSSRRTGAVLGCLFVLVATAGCLGVLTEPESLSFSAKETLVGADSLERTGYAPAGNRTLENELVVRTDGQERDVSIVSRVNVYDRSVDRSELDVNASALSGNASAGTGEAAQFAVLATPVASVRGTSVNPLASMSIEELVRRFVAASRESGGTDTRNGTREPDLTLVENRTVESLDAERTVSTYRSSADGSDASGDSALVHVARFEHDGDRIVVVAGHPALLDERDRVDALLAGLERVEG